MLAQPSLQIPFLYQFFFLFVDPIFALNGAILAHLTPFTFLYGMNPHATPADYSPPHQIVFDQLGATYLMHAALQASVLRITTELGVWKAVLGSILLCDLMHVAAARSAMGDLFFDVGNWRPEDWGNMGALVGLVVLRAAFLLGVGLGDSKDPGKEREEEKKVKE